MNKIAYAGKANIYPDTQYTGRPPVLKMAIARLMADGKARSLQDVCAALGRKTPSKVESVRYCLKQMRMSGLLETSYVNGLLIFEVAK